MSRNRRTLCRYFSTRTCQQETQPLIFLPLSVFYSNPRTWGTSISKQITLKGRRTGKDRSQTSDVRDPQTRLPLRARPPAKQGEAAWGTSGQVTQITQMKIPRGRPQWNTPQYDFPNLRGKQRHQGAERRRSEVRRQRLEDTKRALFPLSFSVVYGSNIKKPNQI